MELFLMAQVLILAFILFQRSKEDLRKACMNIRNTMINHNTTMEIHRLIKLNYATAKEKLNAFVRGQIAINTDSPMLFMKWCKKNNVNEYNYEEIYGGTSIFPITYVFYTPNLMYVYGANYLTKEELEGEIDERPKENQ